MQTRQHPSYPHYNQQGKHYQLLLKSEECQAPTSLGVDSGATVLLQEGTQAPGSG